MAAGAIEVFGYGPPGPALRRRKQVGAQRERPGAVIEREGFEEVETGFPGSPPKVSTSRASPVNSNTRGNSGEMLMRNGLRLS